VTEARTIAEAYVHLELTLPDGEDAVDYRRHTTLHDVDDDHWLLVFEGPYEGRWCAEAVPVSKRATAAARESGERYGAGSSTLVDAGQWYAVESANAGLAELGSADAPPDEQTYWAVLTAWTDAAAAAAEIGKFLPPGADQVPATACWTGYGKRVYARRPDAFRRARLAGDRAAYLRRRDDFQRRFGALFAEPASEAGNAAPAEVAAEDAPAPLPARTYGEVHAYLDLHSCACGSVEFPRAPAVEVSGDRHVVVAFAGRCDGCGRPREHRFRLPARPGLPPGEPFRFSHPGDGPSELLDPGEWVAVAEAYATAADAVVSAMAEAGGAPAPADHRAAGAMLAMAASAVDEVLAFVPPDADEVPEAAHRSATGDEVRHLSPEWFRRPFLTEQRAHRRRLLADFTARYGR